MAEGIAHNQTVATQASSWQSFKDQGDAVGLFAPRRYTPTRRLQLVDVDSVTLFASVRSFFTRILTPRIRRAANVPANELADYTTRGARYLARLTIESMGVVLRNKLEHLGESNLARELIGPETFTVGQPTLKPIAALIETFGTYQVTSRHHDRVLYVARLTRGPNRRFGVAALEASILGELYSKVISNNSLIK